MKRRFAGQTFQTEIDLGRMKGRFWWKSVHPRREGTTEWFVLVDENTGLTVTVPGNWPTSVIEETVDITEERE